MTAREQAKAMRDQGLREIEQRKQARWQAAIRTGKRHEAWHRAGRSWSSRAELDRLLAKRFPTA